MKLCWIALLFTFFTAHAQLPEGNWFLNENTNEWVFGLYDKLAYYKNDFWPYRLVSSKDNETKLLLQKAGTSVSLLINFQNDSTILVNNITLSNVRRPMASPAPDKKPARSNAVYIKGITTSPVQFTIKDPLLGKPALHVPEPDKNGWFAVRLPLPAAASEIAVQFGDHYGSLFADAGDTVTVYLDKDKMIAGGRSGATINEYNDYTLYARQWENHNEQMKMVRNSNEQAYKEYEMNKRSRADSLLEAYQAAHTMSQAVFQRVQQNNKYSFANALLRYLWLHEPNKRLALPAEYASLVNSFTTSNASIADIRFDEFVQEVMTTTVAEHLSNRSVLDSILMAKITPGSLFDYLQQYDKTMTPAQLKDIDRLLKYSPRFSKTNGRLSLVFNTADTLAQKKITSQFTGLINWMINNEYLHHYVENIELAHKLSQLDSLYPASNFRDLLLGHYLYANCLENGRLVLNDNSINRIKDLCNDTTLYMLVLNENAQNKINFDMQRYESLVPSAKEETVLNRIARQHKGKVVYVDVWATWCVPCMEQFSYSKELKKEFEGKPVAFVYLCCDSDITDWQNMIKKYALPGQHLLLTPDEKAKLLSKYNFGSYPRYMVINKQGRLISSNSFAPQQKDIVEPLLTELLSNR